MTDRAAAIRKIAVGDIIHAVGGGNGATHICLVTAVTEKIIHSRSVTRQLPLHFDRRTGVAEWGAKPLLCTIDSTAHLPPEIKEVLLGLDHRYRTSSDPDRARLLDAEKRALSFLFSFYPANQLDQ